MTRPEPEENARCNDASPQWLAEVGEFDALMDSDDDDSTLVLSEDKLANLLDPESPQPTTPPKQRDSVSVSDESGSEAESPSTITVDSDVAADGDITVDSDSDAGQHERGVAPNSDSDAQPPNVTVDVTMAEERELPHTGETEVQETITAYLDNDYADDDATRVLLPEDRKSRPSYRASPAPEVSRRPAVMDRQLEVPSSSLTPASFGATPNFRAGIYRVPLFVLASLTAAALLITLVVQ